MKLKYCLFVLLMAGLSACNRSIDIPEFDESQWQSDKNGCKGIRQQMLSELQQAKDKLKGLNEDEIGQVLGKPDKNELYKRNQKFYIYEITNAPECANKANDSTHVYLNIRFNATGLAKEVLIYKN